MNMSWLICAYGKPTHKKKKTESLQYPHRQTSLCIKGSFMKVSNVIVYKYFFKNSLKVIV